MLELTCFQSSPICKLKTKQIYFLAHMEKTCLLFVIALVWLFPKFLRDTCLMLSEIEWAVARMTGHNFCLHLCLHIVPQICPLIFYTH